MGTRIQPNGFKRRNFLGCLASVTSVGIATKVIGLPASAASGIQETKDLEEDSSGSSRRDNRAYQIRREAALDQKNAPSPSHPTNGDDTRYSNKIGSYSKTLPHNPLG